MQTTGSKPRISAMRAADRQIAQQQHVAGTVKQRNWPVMPSSRPSLISMALLITAITTARWQCIAPFGRDVVPEV